MQDKASLSTSGKHIVMVFLIKIWKATKLQVFRISTVAKYLGSVNLQIFKFCSLILSKNGNAFLNEINIYSCFAHAKSWNYCLLWAFMTDHISTALFSYYERIQETWFRQKQLRIFQAPLASENVMTYL